jgi:penicillin-binding protein 2B
MKMDKQIKNPIISKRAVIMVYIFIALFFLLGARILYIQWDKEVQGHALQVLAEEKWTKQQTLFAERGKIYDKNGIEIARDIPAYTLVAVLKGGKDVEVIDDPYETARKLAPILNMDVNDLTKRLTKENAYQVEFGIKGRNISYTKKQEIEQLNLPGISFTKEKRRLYPNNVFASHVIGYTNNIMKEYQPTQEGAMGIEASTNNYLIEKNGKIFFRTDTKGFKLPNPNELIESPKNGNDVYLTIDHKIQTIVEYALNKVEESYTPERIIAIVANAKTGQILAMSNRPSFDPNIRNITNWTNYAVSSRFEPGSTMKIFTLAAAIEEGLYDPDAIFQSGQYYVAGGIVNDHNQGKGWGKITYLEGVQRSSNVAFTKLAQELGPSKLMEYYKEFGLTNKTGIDLPNEINSIFRYNYPLEQLSTAWGQGSAVTPIQQIQAVTAITNNGKMMQPYIIDRIINPDTGEAVVTNNPAVVSKPISAKTAKVVRDTLETVITSPNGTGKAYYIKGYQVAGKTGTAQIYDSKTNEYMSGWGNNIFSFLGFAPKDDPELIVYVAVDRPNLKNYESGSVPVSTAFNMIMKSSLQYLDIDPINELSNENQVKRTVEIKNYKDKHITDAMTELKSLGIEVITLGNGDRVKQQIPEAGKVVLAGEKVLLHVGGKTTMPDLKGWSMRDVLKLCSLLDLQPNIIGSGFVTMQNIPPKSPVKSNDYLVVELQPSTIDSSPMESENISNID